MSPYLLIGFLIIIPSLVSVTLLVALIKLKTKEVRTKNLNESIAVLELKSDEGKINIWIKKTKEEWPPLCLEIGQRIWTSPIETTGEKTMELLKKVIKESKICDNATMKKDIKYILLKNGATHIIDIRGGKTLPELESFFQEAFASS